MAIHWGRFGDRFVGIRQQGSEQWANASWPGEYVTSYTVEYRKADGEEWKVLHEHRGRPVDEQGEQVQVEKMPTTQAGCSSESITRLTGYDLEGVAELRIRADGGHWIGLYELEVFGHADGVVSTPSQSRMARD